MGYWKLVVFQSRKPSLFIYKQTNPILNKSINKVGSEYYDRKEKVKTFLEN